MYCSGAVNGRVWGFILSVYSYSSGLLMKVLALDLRCGHEYCVGL